MPRVWAVVFGFLLCGPVGAQSRLLVGRIVDATKRPPVPVDKARVRLVNTNQEVVSDRGRFQFSLPPGLVDGSEVQIEVQAGNLRIYLPRNGVLTIPAPGTRPVEVELLEAGSKQFLGPAAIEALLARVAKPSLNAERTDPPQAMERPLQRSVREYAADKGFGLEDVEREVKAWSDQVRANRDKATIRQQALAEFEAQGFAKRAALFNESSSLEAANLDRIAREREDRDQEELLVLRRFLDDKIGEAEALTQGLEYAQAAQVLEGAGERVDRSRYGPWWAEMQTRWGSALVNLGSSGQATQSIVSLQAAVAAYQNALQVYIQAHGTQAWATIQDDLGSAYAQLGERLRGPDAVRSLKEAVNAYQNALQVRTKESLPQAWASTQNNLGTALASLGERLSGPDAVRRLQDAITAYRNALGVRTRESFPQDWAATQNNLGIAYEILSERLSGPEAMITLGYAVTAYQNSLQIGTEEPSAQHSAGTQNNLGNVYLKLAERLTGTIAVETLWKAETAHRNALRVFTKESFPQAWAVTQNALGNVYASLSERLGGPEAVRILQYAVTAYQNSLQVRTKESLPQDWAMTLNNLGNAYSGLGERLIGVDAMEELRYSVLAYQDALEIRTKESFPQEWAKTQSNLGIAQRALGDRLTGAQGVASLWAAVIAFHNSLQVFTEESVPQLWAATQDNLGHADMSLGERLSGKEREESLNSAVTAYRNALRVFTIESFPRNWSRAKHYLAIAFALQEKWTDAAQAEEEVLFFNPKFKDDLFRAEQIYQERLFRFDCAFELNARRVELGEGEFEFVEKHLTTARFDECATRAVSLQSKVSEKGQRVLLMALRFACLAGEGKSGEDRAAGVALRKEMDGVGNVGWKFGGTKHFLSTHAGFSANAGDWVRLFEAIEEGDEGKAGAALAALGV